MNRKEYSLLVENWRRFLVEGEVSSKSSFKNKFLILNDGKSGGMPAVLIGVAHDNDPIVRDNIPNKFQSVIEDAVKRGFYYEGKGDDIKKVSALFGDRLGKNRGQWDNFEEIKGSFDKWKWCYSLFTGDKWNRELWPAQIFEGKGDELDGSIEQDKIAAFQEDLEKRGKKKASDVIYLMLTSKDFGPANVKDKNGNIVSKGLGGLSEHEAKHAISEINNSMNNILDSEVKSKEDFAIIIDSIYKDKGSLFFPGGGDKEGLVSQEVNNARRSNLLEKLKDTGGIGIIGYSHLTHLQNLGKLI